MTGVVKLKSTLQVGRNMEGLPKMCELIAQLGLQAIGPRLLCLEGTEDTWYYIHGENSMNQSGFSQG